MRGGFPDVAPLHPGYERERRRKRGPSRMTKVKEPPRPLSYQSCDKERPAVSHDHRT